MYATVEQFKERLNGIGKDDVNTGVLDVRSLIRWSFEEFSIESQVVIRLPEPEEPQLKHILPARVISEYYKGAPDLALKLALVTRSIVNVYSVAYSIKNIRGFYTGSVITVIWVIIFIVHGGRYFVLK